MKHLLLLLALVLGLASLPVSTFAKDKKNSDDDWKKSTKELGNEFDALQKHYDLMKDRVKNMGGDRRQWEEMRDIRASIDRIGFDLNSGRFDTRDIRARIRQSDDDLRRVQDQLDYNSKHRGGYYRSN